MDQKETQTAIVTGASSGIGLGVTQALLERGWRGRGHLPCDQQFEGAQAVSESRPPGWGRR
jgi:NAD(P)-dependent dehydrogenase (short-subunit alcohol dehydrogenase family)